LFSACTADVLFTGQTSHSMSRVENLLCQTLVWLCE